MRVPTEDGVDVGLEAKISFTTAFTGVGDDKLMKEFDARFGNRTYPIPTGGTRLHPWDGDEGFGAFLDTEFRPVLDNALRETIGRFKCSELISSCALLQQQNINALGKGSGDKTNANLIQVQQAIAKALTDDLSGNLGGNYFKSVQVIVSAVRLPDEVQKSVDEAQARFADVNQSRADLQRAKIRKQVNATLGASYRAAPPARRSTR